MKPLPFPYPLHIGTDIVHIPRIARLLARRGDYLTRFTRRILCEQEQQDFRARFDFPRPSTSNFPSTPNPTTAQPQPQSRQPPPLVTSDMTRWLAGRFAAKEAARKASPAGAASIGWKDVMVQVEEDDNAFGDGVSRKPVIVYLGKEGDGEDSRVGRLSISHDGEYVVATVLAAG